MFTLTRRGARSINIWPGYVDALAALLMVVIFVLLVFTLAQFLLRQLVSEQDLELEVLHQRLAALTDELGLTRERAAGLDAQVSALSARVAALLGEREALVTVREQDRIELERQATQLQALEVLVAEQESQLERERKQATAAQADVAQLDRQLQVLIGQLRVIAEALAAAEEDKRAQAVKIADLGERLNIELARRVNELQRFRSEFFGKVKEAIGDNPALRVAGDRFVFQSELLFASGSAELNQAGRVQLDGLAETLSALQGQIPEGLDWILRIDGHTDAMPLSGAGPYETNWELSTARALSVLRYLASRGIPPRRMAAAGFGQFRPIAAEADAAANRRIEIKLTTP